MNITKNDFNKIDWPKAEKYIDNAFQQVSHAQKCFLQSHSKWASRMIGREAKLYVTVQFWMKPYGVRATDNIYLDSDTSVTYLRNVKDEEANKIGDFLAMVCGPYNLKAVRDFTTFRKGFFAYKIKIADYGPFLKKDGEEKK